MFSLHQFLKYLQNAPEKDVESFKIEVILKPVNFKEEKNQDVERLCDEDE